jgi:hypothetical protein
MKMKMINLNYLILKRGITHEHDVRIRFRSRQTRI